MQAELAEILLARDGPPQCAICEDLGYVRHDVPDDHEDFGRLFECECQLRTRVERLMAISDLSQADREKRLDGIWTYGLPQIADMVDQARHFVECGDGWFTVRGGYGQAKTHLLMASVNEFILGRNREAMYVRTSDLLRHLRQGFEKGESFDARFERMLKVPFLALDEFGEYSPTPWAEENVRSLLDARYQDGLAWDRECLTMIATNRGPDDLPGWVADRMQDSQFTLIHLTGGSMRPHKGGGT